MQTSGASGSSFVAFHGPRRLASGDLAETAISAWRAQQGGNVAILVFDRTTGEVVDLDLRGGEAEVRARYAAAPAATPKRGRPSLGVVAREVTLLPRHWEWLASQPGGASTTLRRLVEAARKADDATTRERREAAYRFMAAIAGDLPGFEEAARALFADDRERLDALTCAWPPDVSDEVLRILDGAPPQERAP